MRGVAGATLVIGLVAVAAVACGGGDSDRFVLTDPETPFVPVIESTDLALGVQRVVLRLVDRAEAPLFPAGTTFTLRTFEPVEGGVRFRTDAALTVVAVGEETFYVGVAPFDGGGTVGVAGAGRSRPRGICCSVLGCRSRWRRQRRHRG